MQRRSSRNQQGRTRCSRHQARRCGRQAVLDDALVASLRRHTRDVARLHPPRGAGRVCSLGYAGFGRNAGKETIIIDASLTPVKDKHGKVVFIAAEGRDITETKAYERDHAPARRDRSQASRNRTKFEEKVAVQTAVLIAKSQKREQAEAASPAGAGCRRLRNLYAQSARHHHQLERRRRTHQGISSSEIVGQHSGSSLRRSRRGPSRKGAENRRKRGKVQGRGLARPQGRHALLCKRRARSNTRQARRTDRICEDHT